MILTEYFLCFNCLKRASWQYAGDSHYACDSCLPRNPCSCNYKLKDGLVAIFKDGDMINSEDDWELIYDENGRLFPCVDWEKL